MAIIQGDILLNAEHCNDVLRKSIKIFQEYIDKTLPAKAPEYYQARNFLREGLALYDEILKKAKLLLGPIPPYSPRDYEQKREQTLIENKIIVRGQSQETLREELVADEWVKKIMTAPEVDSYLKEHYQTQSRGKRKLANIKVRMILDSLKKLASRGQELRVLAQKRFQAEGGA